MRNMIAVEQRKMKHNNILSVSEYALLWALLPATAGYAAVVNVTPASDLVSANAGMSAGDTMQFAPGTYNISSGLNLVNGNSGGAPTSYVGAPGVILHSTSSTNDIFDMKSGTNHDIFIMGIQFDGCSGSSEGAIVFHGNNGTSAAGNISIIGNTFTNFSGSCNGLSIFQGDNIRIEQNTVYSSNNNNYIGNWASIITNDSTQAHQNISVSRNTFYGTQGYVAQIMASGSPPFPYNHLHVNYNTVFDYNMNNSSGFSLVDNSVAATDVTFWGNYIYGGKNTEIAEGNISVIGNTFVRPTGNALLIGHGNTTIYGNNFNDVPISPFGVDGGYTATQYVGVNLINGISTFGWAGVTNYNGITPPTCVPQTPQDQQTLLADGQPPGSITAARVRNILCSVAPGSIIFPGVYP